MADNARLCARFPGRWGPCCLAVDEWSPPDAASRRRWHAAPPAAEMRVSDLLALQGVPCADRHPRWPLWVVLVARHLDGWTPKRPRGYTKAQHADVLRRAALAMRGVPDPGFSCFHGVNRHKFYNIRTA